MYIANTVQNVVLDKVKIENKAFSCLFGSMAHGAWIGNFVAFYLKLGI